MRLLLVHLSDLHITNSQDPVLNRNLQIADSVKNLDYTLDLCIVAITGDLTYSGKEDQYALAWSFLQKLRTDLIAKLSCRTPEERVPVYFVAVPGNHDCDFDRIGAARDMILDGVLKDPNKALDSSIVQVCTQVQEPFYEFLNENAHESRLEASAVNAPYDHKLYYEYRFSAQGHIVRFMCCCVLA